MSRITRERKKKENMDKYQHLSRPYSDWFGRGDTKDDILAVIQRYGEPLEICMEINNGKMACLIYNTKIVVTGYDGAEYCHTFEFNK